MADSLTVSAIFGGAVTIIVGGIGGVVAFRQTKITTELAARRLEMEKQQNAANEWQKLAEHYRARLEYLEGKQPKLLQIRKRRSSEPKVKRIQKPHHD